MCLSLCHPSQKPGPAGAARPFQVFILKRTDLGLHFPYLVHIVVYPRRATSHYSFCYNNNNSISAAQDFISNYDWIPQITRVSTPSLLLYSSSLALSGTICLCQCDVVLKTFVAASKTLRACARATADGVIHLARRQVHKAVEGINKALAGTGKSFVIYPTKAVCRELPQRRISCRTTSPALWESKRRSGWSTKMCAY